MTEVEIPNQLNDTQLSWDEAIAALEELAGSRVAVRIVERKNPEELVAVFRGHLGTSNNSRQPSLFWPVLATSEDEPGDLEGTGIYLQRERFDSAVGRGDLSVLVITQGPVIVNVRDLEKDEAD